MEKLNPSFQKTSYICLGNTQLIQKNNSPISFSLIYLYIPKDKLYPLKIEQIDRHLKSVGANQNIIVIDKEDQSFFTPLLSLNHTVQLIVLQQKAHTGEMVNIAIQECQTDYALVLDNFCYLDRLVITKTRLENWKNQQALMLYPEFFLAQNHQAMASVAIPIVKKKNIWDFLFVRPENQLPCLSGFNYLGFYDKNRFLLLGGYDLNITNHYWQKLDLGVRSFLWDQKLMSVSNFQLIYDHQPFEDNSRSLSFAYFYLKNWAPTWKKNTIRIHWKNFFTFKKYSHLSWKQAKKEFKELSCWVNQNKLLYKKDFSQLIDLWINL